MVSSLPAFEENVDQKDTPPTVAGDPAKPKILIIIVPYIGCNGDGPFVSVPLFSLWLLTGHGRLEIEGIEGIESIE